MTIVMTIMNIVNVLIFYFIYICIINYYTPDMKKEDRRNYSYIFFISYAILNVSYLMAIR